MTRRQLADLVDVGYTTVDLWARGATVPNALVMDDVCKVLSCTLEDIYPPLSD